MYSSGPSDDELEALGFTRDDVDDSEQEVFPENWLPFTIFIDLVRQWRVGMGGPTGLDYSALPFVFDLHEVKKKKRREVFEALRVMEDEALRVMAESSSNTK